MTGQEEIFSGLLRLLDGGKRAALCTLIEKHGSGPREVGAKMVVGEGGETIGTIGGGDMERSLIGEAVKALKEGKPRRPVFVLHKGPKKEGAIETGLICGGELTVFIDVIDPKPRLIIVGSGHVALPLARLADMVGLDVVVVDDEDTATQERFPMAKEVIKIDRLDEALDRIKIRPNDLAAVVHGEPEHDYTALKRLLRKRPAYIGLIGSRMKTQTLKKRLIEDSFNAEEVEAIHAPIGLDIGAETPEEIGISIMAEIIKEKRRPRGEGY